MNIRCEIHQELITLQDTMINVLRETNAKAMALIDAQRLLVNELLQRNADLSEKEDA